MMAFFFRVPGCGSRSYTTTQRIQRMNQIYRWYSHQVYILQPRGRSHAINASLATSWIWCSILYSRFKVPKNRLLFLKLLPIALINRGTLQSATEQKYSMGVFSTPSLKSTLTSAKALPCFLLSFCQQTPIKHLL